MKVAVLFDGAGLARLGLEEAGHTCTGFEIDPQKHALSVHVGSGRSVLADVREVDLSGFDAVWASPPCLTRSRASATPGHTSRSYGEDLLAWALALPHPVLWVENVMPHGRPPAWGTPYNAAQFEEVPRQQRQRMIGGRFPAPHVFRPYTVRYPGVCPTITATEWKGCASDSRRASRFYGRKLTPEECAHHQGFTIPEAWGEVLPGLRPGARRHLIYEAIGNGVPVYMARAFGEAAEDPTPPKLARAVILARRAARALAFAGFRE